MLELLYVNLLDYLARPNAEDRVMAPDDFAVAVALAEADKTASEQKTASLQGAANR